MTRLQKDKEGTYFATIMDEEGDEVVVKFNYDGCATLQTEELSYVCLSAKNLRDVAELLEKAERKYAKE